ncbi:CBS domain-containing protein [Alicyclobacillus acidiphilus]|uniref:CBS domain-containing protein n=1 Tax=Alicyclobacillus acidiphilus TaxID=182455 RepID=UPI0008304341|nr:CBS domain-containing protein [Alicyclobacillus acidiphilus]
MFIRNCLTPIQHLTLLHPTDTVGAALQKMGSLLSLPCVDEENRFLGLVSKRSMFELLERDTFPDGDIEEFLNKPVVECVLRDVPKLTLSDWFEDTIEIITRIPFVPIVEGDKLLGIVKRSDVQRSLAVVFAQNMPCVRLILGVPEVEGVLERLFNITHRLGIDVVTCVPFDAGGNLNRRLILKVHPSPKVPALIDQLERSGFLVVEHSADRQAIS